MGADGCWCASQSSKLLRGVSSFLGGFDSHTFPPKKCVILGHTFYYEVFVDAK